MLVQHSFLKDKEVHIKIGGDDGGGSFKLSYQIGNVSHPNSTDNTLVFSIFEPKDHRSKDWVAWIPRTNKHSANNETVISCTKRYLVFNSGKKISHK